MKIPLWDTVSVQFTTSILFTESIFLEAFNTCFLRKYYTVYYVLCLLSIFFFFYEKSKTLYLLTVRNALDLFLDFNMEYGYRFCTNAQFKYDFEPFKLSARKFIN